MSTKVSSSAASEGEMGQIVLAKGQNLGMRLWKNEAVEASKPATSRDYETVGYVISGRAELHLEGEKIMLEPGDSWVVPRGASHTYEILEPFTAVEATSPPSS